MYLICAGGSTSDRLQQVYKPVLSDSECTGYLGNSYNTRTMLCAGLDQGGKDACQVIWSNYSTMRFISNKWNYIKIS